MIYIYILHSKSASKYYVGSSEDPFKRLEKHNTSSFNTFTSKYRPWVLVAVFKASQARGKAEQVERFIKKQKSKIVIEKLIDPSFVPTGKLAQLVRVPHVRD